jgi:chromosome segregation ATPase
MCRVYERACENRRVASGSAEHLEHAASLAERDEATARELAVVRRLAERAGDLRERAVETRLELDRVPSERQDLARRRDETEAAAEAARSQLRAAEERVAGLEGSRRRREDELARARSERDTARAELADVERQLERLGDLQAELASHEESLRAEAPAIRDAARAVAAEIRRVPRVADSARDDPGTSLEDVEDWGARVRSALFVAQGTLETERERIVGEANALGSAVLGESLGASSVAVVRRRLEQHLR